jgi:4-amino-4-deoxy-L-arabinose transferase-like glycosyltransferase
MLRKADRYALLLTALGFCLRLCLAWWVPLGVDENYTVAVAREFSLSFHDHPLVGFILPSLFLSILPIEHPVVYRLPYVLLGTGTGILLWRIGHILGGAQVALVTVIFWVLAPHMVIGSGLMVVPDAPLNFFLALACLLVLSQVSRVSAPRYEVWIAAGFAVALALASKYQAGLFALAVLMAFFVRPELRHLLYSFAPWLAGLVALTGLLPTLIWNLENDFASFRFHSGRSFGTLNPGNVIAMSGLQLLFLLPPVLFVGLAGLVTAFRKRSTPIEAILSWAAVMPLVFFSVIYALGTWTGGHWTMSGWLFALPLGAKWLIETSKTVRRAVFVSLSLFAVAFWGLVAVLAVHAQTGLLTTATVSVPMWDRQMEMVRLDQLEPTLASTGHLDGINRIIAPDWMQGGQIATAFASRLPVQIAGPKRHHFAHIPDVRVTGPALGIILFNAAESPPDPSLLNTFAQEQGLTARSAEIVTVQTRGDRPHVQALIVRLDD